MTDTTHMKTCHLTPGLYVGIVSANHIFGQALYNAPLGITKISIAPCGCTPNFSDE